MDVIEAAYQAISERAGRENVRCRELGRVPGFYVVIFRDVADRDWEVRISYPSLEVDGVAYLG